MSRLCRRLARRRKSRWIGEVAGLKDEKTISVSSLRCDDQVNEREKLSLDTGE